MPSAPDALLGRSLAKLHPLPRRWVQSLIGLGDTDAREKWALLWPRMRRLPRTGLSVLDAGCGKGIWALEIAARRPAWSVTAIDILQDSVAEAEVSRRTLSLPNVSFHKSDFLDFEGDEEFDLVLSIFSSHYLAAEGRGPALFAQFAKWLKPGGRLFLLAPRRACETPFTPFLPRKRWWDVYSREEILNLSNGSGLFVEHLSGRTGPIGALGKQVAAMIPDGRWRAARLATYPILFILSWLDGNRARGTLSRSVSWLLVARKPLSTSRNTEASNE